MSESNGKRQIWIHPCTSCGCGCNEDDDDQYELVFEIPGVKKEDIHLHVVKNGLRLVAPRDENTEYVNETSFVCEADPDNVSANYDNGILTVAVPYSCPDPFKGTTPVQIK